MMKNILIYALVGVILVLGYQLWKSDRDLRKAQSVYVPQSGVSIQAEEVARKVNEEGMETVVYKEAEPVLKLIEVENTEKIDSALKLADVREKEVKQYQNVVGRVSEENIQLKQQIDEMTRDTSYVYEDKWLDLSFKRKNDTIVLGNFGYDFDFETLSYSRRDWFLGAKKSYTTIWSKDPRVSVRGYDKLTIRQPTPSYGLRVQANANWNPETGALGYGPGLRVDIDRFSFQGNYTYYPESGRWRPMVSGNFDLIRF